MITKGRAQLFKGLNKLEWCFLMKQGRKMEYKHQLQELSEEAKEFIISLTPEEKELHALARKMLGSSYFVEKTPQFLIWKTKKQLTRQSDLSSQSQATK